MSAQPIGILCTDDIGNVLATRLASPTQPVLLHGLKERLSGPMIVRRAYVDIASTATDIALACQVILSTIEDTARLRQVLLGQDNRAGIGAELEPGSVFVDFGVRPPRECQSLLGLLGARGVSIVDAAIMAGADALASGTATVLAGGFPDAVEQVLPVLSAIGPVERTGPLGSAHTAAALMGYMEAAHTIARNEAASIGMALGLNSDVLNRLIEPEAKTCADAPNTRCVGLAKDLATERGLPSDVIDFVDRRLRAAAAESS